ncbi:HAD family hydrolase [Companilactobacillus mishanensis]|uniref:HAD family hydrolase n=1 Tax=Companilactobacillus mishanensis TaxID=2486008 RepID=A0A5P0ZED3_9LACO|nr:HAD family hydrolase [Companilactobacillus mishanensis]MQS44485.1 HAD family hydrolase [Companilactobacillus mishanensis]MQS51411.1 HAD family hydrolase [Companilactobacillus mishanensis]MQS88728.1 HAD family hydrolase [Companilactobacillus mishanensis]
MIKLIATDIDGTFFDDQHHYNIERFNNQLEKLHARDVKFTVASGNYLGHLETVMDASPVDAFVAENGANIEADGKKVFTSYLSPEILQQVMADLDKIDNLRAYILSGDNATYVHENDYAEVDTYYISNYKLVSSIDDVHDNIFKINVGLTTNDLQETEDYLNEKYKGMIHATASGFGSIDIISSGINKSFGLRKIASYYDLALDEILSFGDNSNDKEMLEESGIGVSMLNGTDLLKKSADRITRVDNNHEGVLDTIDEIFEW